MFKIRKKMLNYIIPFLAFSFLLSSTYANAGIALSATRVIYPAGGKQVQLSVINTENDNAFLIQSWVDDASGQKSKNFLITPPLFLMKGKKENILRIVDVTKGGLPSDKESLFWINVKAIPSIDKDKLAENKLQLAIVNRIKLLYRPKDLSMSPEEAPGKLAFIKTGNRLEIKNPTPYYLTLSEFYIGNNKLEGVMVKPMGSEIVTLPKNSGNNVAYRTINDFGAFTAKIEKSVK